MIEFWHTYLYVPLFNFFFLINDTVAGGNLGVSVIILTVVVRMALLPFSFIVERNKAVYSVVSDRIATLRRDLAADPPALKEEIKKVLSGEHISPWASAVVLGVQALIFILLYQVFVGGINGQGFSELYAWVPRPKLIEPMFLGLDIGARNAMFASVVGILLFGAIWADQRTRRNTLTKQDILFQIFFPLATVVLLSFLPAAKTLFILTSMFFSLMLDGMRQLVLLVIPPIIPQSSKKGKKSIAPSGGVDMLAIPGNPWDTLRKKA